jgi:hypothetical protein
MLSYPSNAGIDEKTSVASARVDYSLSAPSMYTLYSDSPLLELGISDIDLNSSSESLQICTSINTV